MHKVTKIIIDQYVPICMYIVVISEGSLNQVVRILFSNADTR